MNSYERSTGTETRFRYSSTEFQKAGRICVERSTNGWHQTNYCECDSKVNSRPRKMKWVDLEKFVSYMQFALG